MPHSITIITSQAISLSTIHGSLSELGGKYKIIAGQDNCYVEDKLTEGISNYVSIDKLRSTTLAKTEYAERDDVPEAFKNVLEDSNFFMVNYNNLSLCNEVLQVFLSENKATLGSIWFDNDYAIILQGAAVLAAVSADNKWNWNK